MQQEARGATSARVAGGAGPARDGTPGRGGGRFEVDGVTVRFGGLTALNAVSLHIDGLFARHVLGCWERGRTSLAADAVPALVAVS